MPPPKHTPDEVEEALNRIMASLSEEDGYREFSVVVIAIVVALFLGLVWLRACGVVG